MRDLSRLWVGVWLAAALSCAACGDDGEAEIEECQPVDSCDCSEGTERETSCVCTGGSNCSISGDSIEFQCDGNAACGLSCGDDCLITCPGTTSCTVDTGDEAVVSCPGTASCDITCRGDCQVDIAGAADAVIRCLEEDSGATCTVNGCNTTECGDGVYACRASCPADGGA